MNRSFGLIRDAYTPPDGDAYWSGLEQRIMARVASPGEGDAVVERSRTLGAPRHSLRRRRSSRSPASSNQQFVESESQLAYDSVLQSVTPDVLATSEEIISVERGTDGATLSYFLSH